MNINEFKQLINQYLNGLDVRDLPDIDFYYYYDPDLSDADFDAMAQDCATDILYDAGLLQDEDDDDWPTDETIRIIENTEYLYLRAVNIAGEGAREFKEEFKDDMYDMIGTDAYCVDWSKVANYYCDDC